MLTLKIRHSFTSLNLLDLQIVKNRWLSFTFQITNDDTKAQIDPNNIQIYQKQVGVDSNLIFNRVNGRCDDKNGM